MKKILMVVNTEIQKDARVLRSAKALCDKYQIDIISMNSDANFKSPDFNSIIYENHKNHGFLLNLRLWLFIIKFCYKNRNNYDLFYFHDYPVVIAGLISSILCKKKWVYDAHELIIDRRKNLILKRYLYIFFERISIRRANLVVAANPERERIIKYIYKLKNTIHVRNIADVSAMNNPNKENSIVFQGAIAKDRNLFPFIDAFKMLSDEITFKIIGGGVDLPKYRTYVNENAMGDKVHFTGTLPYKELIKVSSKSKVGIIVYQMTGLNFIYCEPNKIYEYAHLYQPMLVTPQPGLRHLITKYHIGEVLDYPLRADDISAKIKKIFDNYDSYIAGIDKFLTDYSFENEKKKLLNAVGKQL